MFGSFHALTQPLMSTVLEVQSNALFTVGIAGVQGLRGSMEDAHAVVVHPTSLFVGVFDGHAGHECSDYVSKEFRRPGELCNTDETLPTTPVCHDNNSGGQQLRWRDNNSGGGENHY